MSGFACDPDGWMSTTEEYRAGVAAERDRLLRLALDMIVDWHQAAQTNVTPHHAQGGEAALREFIRRAKEET